MDLQGPLSAVRKVFLMGLDNCGKTSILLSWKGENLMNVYPLKPTKKIDISNYTKGDTSYSVWDFGGQERYVPIYLKGFDRYADSVDELVFVFDVQDGERREIALKYLGDIIQRLEKQPEIPPIRILLHKYDPNLDMEKLTEAKALEKDLIECIKTLLPSTVKYTISRTSICTVFEETPVGAS